MVRIHRLKVTSTEKNSAINRLSCCSRQRPMDFLYHSLLDTQVIKTGLGWPDAYTYITSNVEHWVSWYALLPVKCSLVTRPRSTFLLFAVRKSGESLVSFLIWTWCNQQMTQYSEWKSKVSQLFWAPVYLRSIKSFLPPFYCWHHTCEKRYQALRILCAIEMTWAWEQGVLSSLPWHCNDIDKQVVYTW